MLKIRLTRSTNGFADFSTDDSDQHAVKGIERSRQIAEKWLFAFASDFDAIIRQNLHTAATGRIRGFEQKLQSIGEAFAKLLFEDTEEISAVFDGPKSAPIVFVVDGEYAHLPFEALHNGAYFLCDHLPVMRVLRSNDRAQVRTSNFFRRRLLYLPAIAPDRPEVYRSAVAERENLVDQLRGNGSRMRFVTDSGKAGLSAFLRNLQEANMIHFSGHASAAEIPLPDGEALLPEDVSRLNLSHIEAVFLNACDSASQRPGKGQTFATAFISSGIANFIGYARPVPNKVAEIAAPVFWSHFLRGMPALTAITKVRTELRKFPDIAAYRFFLQHFGEIEFGKKKRPARLKLAAALLAVAAGLGVWQFRRTIVVKPAAETHVASKPQPRAEPSLKVEQQPQKKNAKRKKTATSKKTKPTVKSDPDIAGLIEQFVPVSIKHDFTPEDIHLMDRLWRHMEAKADKNNFICTANIDNGNKRHGSVPIGRRQLIRNLLVFRCIPEAPHDWDARVQDKLREEREQAATDAKNRSLSPPGKK
ncbi:MAG: CHAT domain-containing protein [Spirochaetes bacterium]|nr:CHAT domain-containing protein [Spirochaetota bacterium]